MKNNEQGSRPSDSLLVQIDDEKGGALENSTDTGDTTTQPSRLRTIRAFFQWHRQQPIASFPSETSNQERSSNSLVALDGLRGLACLCVLNQHYSQIYTDRNFYFGWKTSPTDVYIPQFYFIKVLWSGSANVFTFFILSGYVLSVKPLKQMRSQSRDVHKTLVSSIFRRGLRLFAPSAAMIILVGIVAQLGIYYPASWAAQQKLIVAGENIILPRDSIWTMAKEIWDNIRGMINIWNWNVYMPGLDQHLWTIGIEFRASMLLFLFQTGTCRLQSHWRIMLGIAMIFICANSGQPHVMLFFTGMLLAELNLAFQDYQDRREIISLDEPSSWRRYCPAGIARVADGFMNSRSRIFRLTQFSLFILGLYLMCCPFLEAEKAPGYIWLMAYTRPSWYHADHGAFWLWSVGATLLVATAVNLPEISWLYTNRFSKYAGKISYALYLVHGPIYHAVAYGMLPVWAWATESIGGRATQVGFTAQWLLGIMVCAPLIKFAADLVYKYLDVPMVRFARWCEGRMEDSRLSG